MNFRFTNHFSNYFQPPSEEIKTADDEDEEEDNDDALLKESNESKSINTDIA